MSKNMKALVLTQHGDLDQLQVVDTHPRPTPQPGHVVLRVGASSFNYHDVFTVIGMPGITIPLPVVPGLDLAGTLVDIGDGVDGWRIGDRVLVNPLKPDVGLMGEMIDGGMAEYALADAAQLIALPDSVSFAQAAALPVAYGTAHRMLITHHTIKSGDRVLILGASGGVGSACVVLAKRLGAEVIACVGSDEKGGALRALGADHIVNYRETDFSRWAIATFGKPQRRTYEGGVDVVINFTGGDTWRPSLRCLKRGGLLLVCGATAGYDPQEDLRYVWSFELNIKGSNSFYQEDLVSLLDQVARGEIDPLIDRIIPLEQAAEGLRLIRDREVLGKVIVTP
ncbi:zinc-binding dehydrogenase [Lonsdalea britannica]|uniref:Zinc-binding dehydrogenase n=1 Tax=Lonsdalea britannica TaxID=1082704 RepID=A0AAD0SIA7_9GAMM|nr:zinc-binding dehydrogenase [Lonsdalea britannica]AXW88320.1 zinc-binding dehydrogenase [Lonsdalea britannica]OSM97307.1 zinc-binding dehydrogenase [Lonsdalea britannica]